MANFWYFYILSSFPAYSWFTCTTMSLELLFSTKLLTPRVLASLKLVSIASYFSSLFDVANWSCNPYLRTYLSGNIKLTTTPLSSLMPSAWIFQNCVWSSPEKVNSTINSTNSCALIVDQGLYSMLNLLSSTAYCTRRLVTSGLFIAFMIGWSIITMIGYA